MGGSKSSVSHFCEPYDSATSAGLMWFCFVESRLKQIPQINFTVLAVGGMQLLGEVKFLFSYSHMGHEYFSS